MVATLTLGDNMNKFFATLCACATLVGSPALSQTLIASPFSPVNSTNSNNQSPTQTNSVDNSLGLSSANANGNTSTNTNINPSNATVGPVTNTNGVNSFNVERVTTTSGPATTTSGPASTTSGSASTTSGAASTVSGSASTTSGPATTNAGNIQNSAAGGAGGTSSSTSGAYQTQSVDNSGNSTNTNNNRTGDVTGNTLSGTNTASQNANNDVNVKVDGDTYIAPKPAVATAYAAPTVIGGGVCAYTPASGSVTTRVVGLSGSGAKIDKGCQNRANADILARLGYVRQAAALLMQDKDVAAAFATVATAEANENK